MAEGRFERNLLERLSKGEDCVWIFIPDKVSEGKITKDEALTSLKTCLEITIPRYKEIVKTIKYEDYEKRIREELPKRLEEAERAFESINNGCKDIIYRGIKLD